MRETMKFEYKLYKNYYQGYEGEVEYIFTIIGNDKEFYSFSVWDGYFSPLLESIGESLPDTLRQWEHNLDKYWKEPEHEWELEPTNLLTGLVKADWNNLEEYKDMSAEWKRDVGFLLTDLICVTEFAIKNKWVMKLKRD